VSFLQEQLFLECSLGEEFIRIKGTYQLEGRCMMRNQVIAISLADATAGTRTEAKVQALSWLARQLAWEQTLDGLRGDEHAQAA
jgi:hypothetical protein